MATRNTYTPQTWENLPSEETPLSAERLEHIENGIDECFETRALRQVYNDNYIAIGVESAPNGCIIHGSNCSASDPNSYSGGVFLSNSGVCSHNEGASNTINGGSFIHQEGSENISNGGSSTHIEGNGNKSSGNSYSHIEGELNEANGSNASHTEGKNNKLNGNCHGSHVEGQANNIYPTGGRNIASHVEGYGNECHASYSHVEGRNNKEYVSSTSSMSNHLEGDSNILTTNNGLALHIEGSGNKAGKENKNAGSYIHIEGYGNVGFGEGSHLEGITNNESELGTNRANHIEGQDNTLTGNNSYVHTSGFHNEVRQSMSGSIFGMYNTLNGEAQFVCGKYNAEDTTKAFIVGGGTYDTQDDDGNTVSGKKNIYTLDWLGNATFAGNVQSVYDGQTISLQGLYEKIAALTERVNSLEGEKKTP